MSKKIVITGGHFTPGLAVIEKLNKGSWDIFWIGEERAIEKKGIKTLEALVLPTTNIPFFSIYSAKLHRKFSIQNLLTFWKLPMGFVQSLVILFKVKPNIVLSFGSYVSVPVAYAAWFLRIPVIIHEQTVVSGLANRLVSPIARKVAVSFLESAKFLPEEKVVLTGNPVRQAIFDIAEKKKINKGESVLYITGGSRGSQIINKNVLEVLPRILKICSVYHQTGQFDFEKVQDYKKRLLPGLRKKYNIQATYTPQEVEEIYKKANLVISRAGANTVSEIAAVGIPAIFIPISWVESDEQRKNAMILVNAGSAIILPERELSGENLIQTVKSMFKNIDFYNSKANKAKILIPKDAAGKLLGLIEECMT